ncbi:uncharacterized protein LOC128078370 isoform X2 [Tympanuchus pallidicinctus]|uniref:uncharacterized protein LOC128078370 isoform X2 n=1 Tax=Tympanuchus pallidicinctus TaxID=109042 RepID=UPI0022871541|nr:uncharacterized protein LOC128078370 isoform X2 [Tympanuchus pallidicinctus]
MAAPHPARHLSAAHRPAGARLLPRAWLLPPRTALLPGGRAPSCRWSAPPRSPAPSRRRHLGAVAAEEVRCGPSEPRGHGGLRPWRLLKASAFSNVGPSAAPRPAPAQGGLCCIIRGCSSAEVTSAARTKEKQRCWAASPKHQIRRKQDTKAAATDALQGEVSTSAFLPAAEHIASLQHVRLRWTVQSLPLPPWTWMQSPARISPCCHWT